ncbi:unnamed protein product [Adineta ricciae]|uniref:Uncharacterized protein n=1 Tax=Adineta ricciae TaxID=249248 RepID=A0A815IZJ2_ADIRI|nr:unnamed protein product [Adineta ricciae]
MRFSQSPIFTRDYRYQSQFYFQLLSTLCTMANQTINESLELFYRTKFVSKELYHSKVFNTQTDLIMKQFQQTIPESYQRIIGLLKSNFEINQFVTPTNSWFLYDYRDSNGNYILRLLYFRYNSKERPTCDASSEDPLRYSCSLPSYDLCHRQTIIKDKRFDSIIIPGMYQTWFPLQAVLISTLECLYNRTCLSEIKKFILSNISLDDYNILTDCSENETFSPIENLTNKLFIRSWLNGSSYQSYFNQCRPLSCQYTYKTKFQTIYIVTNLIGLMGGLQISLRLVLPIIILILVKMRTFIFQHRQMNINELESIRTLYAFGFIFGYMLMTYENQNAASFRSIVIVVLILSQAMFFFSFAGPYLQSLSEARGAAARVFQLIDEARDTSKNETEIWNDSILGEELIDVNCDIEFININFAYPSRKNIPVLNNLNLIARTGQTTALVGASGCGKSTCLSLLLRYYELESGRIMINNRSITDYNLKQLRQHIGVVSQEPILFGMSIYENIRFGKSNATRIEIEQAAQQANAHDFIMKLPKKYETLVGERGIQLSGGEKQRIALARALVKQPVLLLLDEATSALDSVNEKLVQEALDRACKGRTTIIISHRLSTIQNASHIYVIGNGSVIEQGTHEMLMVKEGGRYREMVKMQQIEAKNKDNNGKINTTKTKRNDEKEISEYCNLLDNGQTTDMNKKTSMPFTHRFIFLRLLSMNSPEWRTIFIGCVACLFNGATQSVFAILVTNIIKAFNDCLYNERRRKVLSSSFVLLGLGVIVLFLRFFQYTAFAISGSKLTQRIRLKAFKCLLRQEITYFDQPENSSGAISTRLSTDASAIQQMTGSRLGVICESLAMACFGFTFGIFFNMQLTLIVLIPLIIYIAFTYMNIRFNMWLNQQDGVILEQASSLTTEVIHNMRTIKQLSMEKEMLQQYSALLRQKLIIFRKYSVRSSLSYGVFWAVDAYVVAFLFWRALVLVEQNKISLNNIIMIFAFAIFTTQTLRIVGTMTQQIGRSLSAAKNFFDLFDRTPDIETASAKQQQLDGFRGEVKYDNVKFAYPTRPTTNILNNFQLHIKPGASGCGKSTIIQLLERFYDVEYGQILLDGIDIRLLSTDWIRSQISLVSQEPVLFNLTIAENIAYGLENVPMEDIIDAAEKANIHSFIQQLPENYETKVGMKGSLLSGGEKQRIAIARALLRQPKILLLDEASSALDANNEQIVQKSLERAQTEDPSRTSIIIAHRLSTIRSCDLICVVHNGYIVESGTHTELMQQRGAYYFMCYLDNI